MRTTTLRALALAGLLAAAVAVAGQDSSSTGVFEVVESFSSSGVADASEGFSSSAVSNVGGGGVVESSSAPVTNDDSSAVTSSTAAAAAGGGGGGGSSDVASSTAAAAAGGASSDAVSSTAVAVGGGGGGGGSSDVVSSTAAAAAGGGGGGGGGGSPAVASSTAAAGGASSDNTHAQSSSAAPRAPLTGPQALNPAVAPDGTSPPNGQCYFPTDGSNVVPAGATYLSSAHFTIVGPAPDTGRPGQLAVLTPANNGNGGGVVTVLSDNVFPCETAGCTVDVTGPIADENGGVLQVTGGQIIGLCLPWPNELQSFGYDASATGTFSAIDRTLVKDSQSNFPTFASSDYFTPAFNGKLLFTLEYGYPMTSSTAGAAAGGSNNNAVASSTGVASNNGNNPRAVSSSTGSQRGGDANHGAVSSSSADVRRMASSSSSTGRMASASSSTGPRVVDSSTLPAWIYNISSSGIGGSDCIPGLTCAAPHAASSSVGMILAAAFLALVAAFAQ